METWIVTITELILIAITELILIIIIELIHVMITITKIDYYYKTNIDRT